MIAGAVAVILSSLWATFDFVSINYKRTVITSKITKALLSREEARKQIIDAYTEWIISSNEKRYNCKFSDQDKERARNIATKKVTNEVLDGKEYLRDVVMI